MRNGRLIAISAAIAVVIAMPPATGADNTDGSLLAQASPAPTRPPAPRTPAPAGQPPSAAAQAPGGAAQPTAAAAQAPAPQTPIRTEILNFDNWVVTCNEFAEGAKTRTCAAVLRMVQAEHKSGGVCLVGRDRCQQAAACRSADADRREHRSGRRASRWEGGTAEIRIHQLRHRWVYRQYAHGRQLGAGDGDCGNGGGHRPGVPGQQCAV